ncbi:hypothetical protein AAY473_000854 [Plecturocebus cupreus]
MDALLSVPRQRKHLLRLRLQQTPKAQETKENIDNRLHQCLKFPYMEGYYQKIGKAQWLTPVIPALREADAGGSPESEDLTLLPRLECSGTVAHACNPSTLGGHGGGGWGRWGVWEKPDHLWSGVQDHPGQGGKTPSLQKTNKRKLDGHSGQHLSSQLLGGVRQENHVNGEAAAAAAPKPECGGVISAHCNFRLLGSSNSCASASQRQAFTMLPRVVSNSSASQSAGITGLNHCTWHHMKLRREDCLNPGGQGCSEL